ncbi:methyl-accepting chemotaxis protein [Sporohalobacter salinus]|uniref:methyl-accepting chemotaxis protein n=1 Tax=Sporohalobacter salinus TaxID=1494606 RepID=UPI00195F7690|nr:methyl-accepting chemotaxis protein [Sporohalobacter salinus]MBM7622791.1 methyl-accepting chemotaxis protein [Sporohalobacter salinus]
MERSEEDLSKTGEISLHKSLKVRVIGVIIGIMVLAILTLGFMINDSVSEGVSNLSEKRNLEIAKSMQAKTNAFFRRAEDTIKLASLNNAVKEANKAKMVKKFKKIKKEHSYFRLLYLGTKGGVMKEYPETDFDPGYDPRQRPWYKKAKQEGKLVWTDIYSDAATGDRMITVAMPVYDQQNDFVGVLAGDLSLHQLTQTIANVKFGEAGRVYLINDKGRLLAHPNEKLVKEKFDVEKLFNLDEVMSKKSGKVRYDYDGTAKLASYVKVDKINGALFASMPVNEVYSVRDSIRQKIIIFGFVVILLLSGIVYFINNKYLFKPIDNLVQKVFQVADGDLTVVTKTDRDDEIGQLQTALDGMSANLRKIVTDLKDIIEDLSAYSEELSASAQEGNAIVETSTENIEAMANSIQEISTSSQEVTSLAQEANSQAEVGNDKIEKVTDIKEINQVAKNAVSSINELDSNSEEIGKIVEMITNIAEQTNMLALNAAIEAARAGKHGQGFAVVAEEIRSLAEETAEATQEIDELIRDTQQKSKAGLKAVEGVEDKIQERKETLQETSEVFTRIKEAIENTSAHIQETSASTQNLAENSDQVEGASQEMKNMSEEISTSSQELANMAQELQKSIERFKV